MYKESRFTTLRSSHPEEAKKLLEEAQQDVQDRRQMYEAWAKMNPGQPDKPPQ